MNYDEPDNLQMTYESPGPNPRFWKICGEGEGDEGITLADGSKGTVFEDMYDAPVTTIYNSTAFQIGGTYGGIREEMYEFQLAFHVKPAQGRPLRINESRFRKGLQYKKDGKIHCRVGNSHRWLVVRMRGTPKFKVVTDPHKQKYGLLLITFVAQYPRWMEDDVTDSFVTETDTTSGGTEIGGLWVSNPTDVEIWLKYSVQGVAGIVWSLPDFSFEDDRHDRAEEDEDRMVDLPELLNLEHLAIDTDEMTRVGQVNSSLDTAVYQRMDGRQFLYPVPPYTDPIELPVAVTEAPIGAGVQVRCPRTWTRPWGLE